MNTLKLKVLLILSNRHLFQSVGKAIRVWATANLAGCTILYGLGLFFLQSPVDFIAGLILSLIFSSPAVVIGTWVLYVLPSINTIFKRTALALISILATSSVIMLIVAVVVHMQYGEVVRILYPFTLAAIVCFFLIARKQIVSKTID